MLVLEVYIIPKTVTLSLLTISTVFDIYYHFIRVVTVTEFINEICHCFTYTTVFTINEKYYHRIEQYYYYSISYQNYNP